MKKLLCAFLLLPSLAWADITVTPGAGKTVATTTDNSREIQNVLVTSSSIMNAANVGVVVGWQVGGGSIPVHEAGTAKVDGSAVIQPVSGTFWQTTQPVSVATPYTVLVGSFQVIGNDGVSRGVGYASQSSSVPVNVLNTLTVNTHAVTQSGAWPVSNLNGVVISSFASTALPMSNVVMIASSPVKTSGTAGEQLVSVEIAASSNTVVVSSFGVVGIDGVSRGAGYASQSSSVPVNVINTPAVTQSGTWNIGTVTTLTGITNGLPTGTNNVGTVNGSSVTIVAPNNNTTAIPVSGSFAVNNPSTATISATYPSGATAVGFLSPTGQIQAGRVDVSSNIYVNIAAGGGTGGTASNFSALLPAQGTAIGFVGATGQMQAAKVDVSSNIFVTQNAPQSLQTSAYISGSSNTVIVSTMGVLDIGGVSRPLGYSAPSSSMPVNVLNTVTITGSISNTGFNATQSGAWTIGNLNGVVISSYAATVAPMVNVVMVASSPVRTSGTTGEQLVSVEIAGSSNTVIVSSFGVVGIDGTSRGVGYNSQGSSVPVNVLNTINAAQSGTWTVQPGNTANTTPWLVTVSTLQVITNSGTSNHIGWDAQGSSVPVASAGPATGVALTVNPTYAGLYVSSSTFPTLRTNGQGQYQVSDPAGRTISVGGVPSWMIKTATITLTGTTPITLIASAAASNFNDLCGCIGTNTSATNTYVTFQSTGALGGGWPASDFTLGMPANDVPAGFGPAQCEHPIPQRAAAANWLVQAANAVTDLRLACYYYTIAR